MSGIMRFGYRDIRRGARQNSIVFFSTELSDVRDASSSVKQLRRTQEISGTRRGEHLFELTSTRGNQHLSAWHAKGVELRSRVDGRYLPAQQGVRVHCLWRVTPSLSFCLVVTCVARKKQPSRIWPERIWISRVASFKNLVFVIIVTFAVCLYLFVTFCISVAFVLSCARLRSCFCICTFVRASTQLFLYLHFRARASPCWFLYLHVCARASPYLFSYVYVRARASLCLLLYVWV